MSKNQAYQLSTKAGQNIAANLARLGLVMKVLPLEATRQVVKPVKHLSKFIIETQKQKGQINTEALQRRASKITSGVDKFLKMQQLLCEWMSPMIVTFIETFLEDGFALLATKDTKLLKHDPIEPEMVFAAESIGDLQDELRWRWARKTVRGGPTNWIKTLKLMGAPSYSEDCQLRLEHLWDTRNVIVHARSIANPSYLAKYHNTALKPGDRINVNLRTIQWWGQGVQSFVEQTDKFLSSYGSSGTRKKDQRGGSKTAEQ